jgi:peptide/nickel transport system substrate-binding protein
MRITRRLALIAAPVTLAVALAACSGSSGPTASGNNSSAPSGHKVPGGTVNMAWTAASPNFIFPLAPVTNTNGFNQNLYEPMWPNLVYAGDGGQSIVNPQESLFSSIKYTNGDRTATIVLKSWNWSDGKPITSRDFTFVYNILKAETANWAYYIPGLFPTDVSSVSTPNVHTVVLNLTHAYNPAFYTEDVLSGVPLMPQHAWDKTSASGPVGNYDQSTAGAKAVWAFLQKEGSQMSTFTTNPLWKVVDGPWTLAGFSSNTDWEYVPNKHYSGPDKPSISRMNNLVYTTDTAELDALRSGNTLQVGGLPLNDVQQIPELKASGYSTVTQAIPGVAQILPNFYSSSVGMILRQLYVRQALEDLINRPQIVSKVYDGYSDPGNGPVPIQPGGPWVSPLEKSGGPYPYSPSKAIALLKAHGWKVVPNGTSTCQTPGTGPTDCGTGITAGEALNFTLAYSSGSTTFDEQEAAIQSSEAQAGVKINLKSEPFNTLAATVGICNASSHPASGCSWQLVDEGYDPDLGLYPAGSQFFLTNGPDNQGGYSSTEMNNLINATQYGSSSQAFYNYEDYAAEQLPWLWLPNSSNILVYKSNLGGFAPLNPFSGALNPEDWYFTSGS